MKVCVLFNPQAGSAGQLAAVREALGPDVDLIELGPKDDFGVMAADAARRGFDLVAVAGGDGSVHMAAAGLLAAGAAVPLAVLPLGTGNDFARTMAVPLDPAAAAGLLRTGTIRAVDVARVEGAATGVMVNAAAGGFSGKVASEVTPELKQFWGPLAYLRGAVGPAGELPRYRVTLRLDGGPAERFDALNVVVANARTAAGGLPVAPTADPEDGLLDVVVVRAGDMLDLSVIAARLMHGDYLADENVVHRLAGRVEVESDPAMSFSIDGELFEGSRFVFTVVPKALRVLAGPDYRRSPSPGPPVEEEGEARPPAAPLAPEAPRGLRHRLFGLLAGVLLLVKRTPRGYAIGFGLIAVAVLTFAWLANGAVGGRWQEWNESVRRAQFARASPALDSLALAVTRLCDADGTAAVVTALLLFFLVRKQYLNAATLLAVVLGVLALEAVLKPFFAIARPEPFPVPDPFTARGHSFPSGHALRGAGIFGFLAGLAAIRGYSRGVAWWWVLAAGWVVLAAGVCWSRVYLGVHTPTDVIAGGVAAAAWVSACLIARHYAMTRPKKRAVP